MVLLSHTTARLGRVLSLSGSLVASACLLPVASLPADEADVAEPYLVTLRDGSRFRATLPAAALDFEESSAANAGVTRVSLPLAQVSRVEFSRSSGQLRITEILRAVAGLDSEAYDEREQATHWLLRNTEGFRPLLGHRLRAPGLSPESRWRIGALLNRLPDETVAASLRPFDRIYPEKGDARDGDLGDWESPASFRGTTITLNRKNVAALSRTGPGADAGASEGIRILEGPEDPVFTAESRSLGFDTDSEGRALNVGDDITSRFEGDGVTFSTSVPDSFVSVNLYEVSGPSRGTSVATHNPLYEGMVTIRFCMPGNPGIPAGVQGVGLWLAVVKKDGTTLQALDAAGELIAERNTSGRPSEFLGFWSEVPIHALRIVPHPDIDPNYTLDDLVFTPQCPVDGLGVTDYPTLGFRNGDRVVCRDFLIGEGEVAFRPSGFETSTVRSPLAEIRTLHAPVRKHPAGIDPESYWIRLSDGSCFLSSSGKDQTLARLDDLPTASLPLAALWGPSRVPSPVPSASTWQSESGPLLIDEKGARALPSSRMGSRWIESVGEPFPDDLNFTYADSPMIWFARSAPVPLQAGQVRFPNGERIILGGSSGFSLKGITTDAVLIEREGREWRFAFSETSAIQLPEP